ncbi:SpoIIE family protein phosphatase [Lachnospiraceae bacterium ZAX-1]
MNKAKLKQILLYALAVAVAKIPLAGCYPFIAGFFVAAYLEEVNRTLLLIFTIFGMTLFLPVQAMAKYSMVVMVCAIAIKFVEWANKSCRTRVGAFICGVSVMLLSVAGELLLIRNRASIWMGIMESVFVVGFVLVLTPLLHTYLEGRGAIGGRAIVGNLIGGGYRGKPKRTQITAPENTERLQSYAESFNGLSKMFYRMSHQKNGFGLEEFGKMQREVTGKLCIACDQCALCWQEETSPMYQIFYGLIYSLEQLGTPDKEVVRQLSEYCPYSQAVVEEATGVFEKARLNLSWYNRLVENREVIAQQLDAMAYIMEDCAKEYKDVSKEEGKMLATVRYRMKERGVHTQEMHLFEKQNARLSLQVKVVSRWGNYIAVKELTKAVCEGLKKNMIPAKNCKSLVGKEECLLVFEEEPLFHTLHGVSRLTKDGAQISGDNFSFLDLEGGQSVLTLSDGMGSGIRACKESEMVIELIEKFLETGFQKETAIRMMNSAMVMHGEDGMFSTVDLAAIDLYTGMCEFYKIGASSTFIKRGDEVECIGSAGLPAGVFHQVEIEKSNRQLADGDFLVLLSDGVMDCLHVPEPEETMKEMLENIQINNSGQLAKQLLDQILLFTAGKVPDDMTVLTAGIWAK